MNFSIILELNVEHERSLLHWNTRIRLKRDGKFGRYATILLCELARRIEDVVYWRICTV